MGMTWSGLSPVGPMGNTLGGGHNLEANMNNLHEGSLSGGLLNGGQIPSWVNREAFLLANDLVMRTTMMRPILPDVRRHDIALSAILTEYSSLPPDWQQLQDVPASHFLLRQATQGAALQAL